MVQKSLLAGVVAGIGASACCVLPLALVGLGLGGAWLAYLTALEPLRPLFVGVALLFLGLAFRRLYGRAAECRLGEACTEPGVWRRQRLIFWCTALPLLALLGFPWYGPWLL